jgi:rhodanese-related sulfurtransferase/DNA-binding transcriptional ArsR family regulator
MGDSQAKAALHERFAEVGRALASGRRLELLDLLAQGERTVDALASVAGLGMTTTSAHLQVLRRAGLVTVRKAGTRAHYSLAGADVAQLLVTLRAVAQDRTPGTEPARRAYLGVDAGAGVDAEVAADDLLGRAGDLPFVVLDVRPVHEFDQGHVPGAVSIPLAELAHRLDELPQGRRVVAYCRGRYCAFAHEAVRVLRAHGVDASRLRDGMLEWRLTGRPVATGNAA